MPAVGSPNAGLEFYTDERGDDADVHVMYGKVILTHGGKPMEYQICGQNHYENKFPDRDKSTYSSDMKGHPDSDKQ